MGIVWLTVKPLLSFVWNRQYLLQSHYSLSVLCMEEFSGNFGLFFLRRSVWGMCELPISGFLLSPWFGCWTQNAFDNKPSYLKSRIWITMKHFLSRYHIPDFPYATWKNYIPSDCLIALKSFATTLPMSLLSRKVSTSQNHMKALDKFCPTSATFVY